jgi:hypothetical protein
MVVSISAITSIVVELTTYSTNMLFANGIVDMHDMICDVHVCYTPDATTASVGISPTLNIPPNSIVFIPFLLLMQCMHMRRRKHTNKKVAY